MNPIPHATWAAVYDRAYDEIYGRVLDSLTTKTIEVVADNVPAQGRIVDFGAGTGRLAIPLALNGYDVVAVEPCREMLEQLALKQQGASGKARAVCSTMQEFSDSGFDLALCVFTVLAYLLDEDSLEQALRTAHSALKPDGYFLLDVPQRRIFGGFAAERDTVKRVVTVNPQQNDIYLYRERLEVHHGEFVGRVFDDEFRIRYWPPNRVRAILEGIGFEIVRDFSQTSPFDYSGAHYWLMRKTG